jgi:hypothetical protein
MVCNRENFIFLPLLLCWELKAQRRQNEWHKKSWKWNRQRPYEIEPKYAANSLTTCQNLLCIKVSGCSREDSKHTRIINKQLKKQEPRCSLFGGGVLLRVDCQSTTFLMNVMPPYLASGRHSETPVTTDQSARRYNSQYLDLQQHRSKNLKPRTDRNCRVRICSAMKWFRERSNTEHPLCVWNSRLLRASWLRYLTNNDEMVKWVQYVARMDHTRIHTKL